MERNDGQWYTDWRGSPIWDGVNIQATAIEEDTSTSPASSSSTKYDDNDDDDDNSDLSTPLRIGMIANWYVQWCRHQHKLPQSMVFPLLVVHSILLPALRHLPSFVVFFEPNFLLTPRSIVPLDRHYLRLSIRQSSSISIQHHIDFFVYLFVYCFTYDSFRFVSQTVLDIVCCVGLRTRYRKYHNTNIFVGFFPILFGIIHPLLRHCSPCGQHRHHLIKNFRALFSTTLTPRTTSKGEGLLLLGSREERATPLVLILRPMAIIVAPCPLQAVDGILRVTI